MTLEIAAVDQAQLCRAHVAEQVAALENDVQFVLRTGGYYVVRSKQSAAVRRSKDRL
jgi:hypothetical protein